MFLMSFLFFQGCAGTMNGKTQDIKVTTVPAYAKITVDTLPGTTFMAPTRIPLDRNKPHVITAETPGHEKINTIIAPRTDGMALALDCLVWLCVPLVFDMPDGATQELYPKAVTLVLPKKTRVPQ